MIFIVSNQYLLIFLTKGMQILISFQVETRLSAAVSSTSLLALLLLFAEKTQKEFRIFSSLHAWWRALLFAAGLHSLLAEKTTTCCRLTKNERPTE